MSNDDWMHLMIEVPPEDGRALLMLLAEKLQFRDSPADFCEMVRDDGARVSYGPCKPRFYGPTEVEGT